MSRIMLLAGAWALALTQVASAQPTIVNEDQKLLASDGAARDAFGVSVAASGNVIVVGAVNNDDRSGSYVYRWDGAQWVEEQKLVASDREPLEELDFGRSVAVSGDVIVVGAPTEGPVIFSHFGAAYVYRWDGAQWVEEQKLVASDREGGENFGWSLNISGDVIVVGSYHDDDNGFLSGSAYVYRWNGVQWVEEQKLLASDGGHQDLFGISVATSGDVIVVGALYGGVDRGGAAYIYTWNGAQWAQEEKLLATDGSTYDRFGYSVAASSDLIVATGHGFANVYAWNGTQWVEAQQLRPSDGAVGFGYSGNCVATSGDVIVVGAFRQFPGFDDIGPGSAYVYRWDGTQWIEERILLASDGANVDYFGSSVAASGDVIVAGAYRDDDHGDGSGSAYVFGEPVEPDNQPPVITCNGPVVLWSPDHELVDVSSAISVSDPDGDPVTLTFRVFSDESEIPETGDGTGRHAPDFKNETFAGGRGVLVRNERRGREDGRFYIAVITADDGNGGVTTEVCTLAVVPHDQNDPASLDDVLAQAAAGEAAVQAAVDSNTLPPPGLVEHGLSGELGPHQ